MLTDFGRAQPEFGHGWHRFGQSPAICAIFARRFVRFVVWIRPNIGDLGKRWPESVLIPRRSSIVCGGPEVGAVKFWASVGRRHATRPSQTNFGRLQPQRGKTSGSRSKSILARLWPLPWSPESVPRRFPSECEGLRSGRAPVWHAGPRVTARAAQPPLLGPKLPAPSKL